MKIGVIADIHANKIALKAVLKDIINNGVEKIFILGDLVGYYYEPDKVLDYINKLTNFELIQGNHERMLKDALYNDKKAHYIRKKYGHGIDDALEKLTKKTNTVSH